MAAALLASTVGAAGCSGGCGSVNPTDGGGGDDAAMGSDAAAMTDAGPGTDGAVATDGGQPGTDAGSGLPCSSDGDCVTGAEWCVGGSCVACDNSGLVCDIACALSGWTTYERNGCFPCECAPANDCTVDTECAVGGGAGRCYAGAFCWDWCPAADPTCCMGNRCAAPGCPEPAAFGCIDRGCPAGATCDPMAGCAPSSCGCSGGAWLCTADCAGGICI